MIVIDTLARAMGGGDENSGQDMGRLIRHADLLRQMTGAHVHLVHHSGKDAGRGARGHSSLLGALDTEIHVEEHEDGTRVATITKQKDGEEGIKAAYRLVPVELGRDSDDEPVTSCLVEPCEVPEKAKGKGALSDLQRITLEALRQFVADHGEPNPGGTGWPEPGRYRTVEEVKFRHFAAGKHHHDTPRERARAVRRAIEALQSKGLVQTNAERIWIV